uniref:EGF-like domain-containing protein n=1 Tax=Syphacia muris TaxID=451379 RepID=A0A0N5AA17_9BILA
MSTIVSQLIKLCLAVSIFHLLLQQVSSLAVRNDCKPYSVCFNHYDCRGGTCFGKAIGKCNCNACHEGEICSDDNACGGLKGACDYHIRRCNCTKGLMAHGFRSYEEAREQVCNKAFCVPSTESCFGLPCNSGLCDCGGPS